MRVLRLCSVFEPPDAVLRGRGVRFDPIGGMQNHTASLTRALDARGIAQDVLTARPPGAPRRQRIGRRSTVRRFGVPVHVARQGWAAFAAPSALRLAAGADLVHAHVGEDLAVLPLAAAAARLQGRPLIVTVHTSLRHTYTAEGPRSAVLKAVGGRIEAATTRRADRVIALTSRLARLLADGGVPADRTHVIPSGVARRDFALPSRDPFRGIPRPRILFVGRMARQKGIAVLAAAVPLLRTPEAHLIVVGDGPERRSFDAAIRAHGLQDRVHVQGFFPHHHVPAALRHADVFVMPSIYEELGSVLLEAMHAGLPIVASHTGGVPEAIGSAGILVTPGDPRALAHAVDALLDDRGLARLLGERARERARAYDWDVLAEQVAGVYDAALGRPAAGPETGWAAAGAGAGDVAGDELPTRA